MGVDFGLLGLRQRRHFQGPLIVHQPRHQIGAVAAEIEERAGAALRRIAQPGEKLGRYVDLLGALMAVHRYHLADFARGLLVVEQAPYLAVAAVPRGLVIHQDGSIVTLGGLLDGARLLHVHGQRLFHHHGYVARRACLHHFEVRVSIGKGRDGFRFHGVEHLTKIGIHQTVGKVVRLGITCQQRGVGIPHANDDDIGGAAARAVQESRNVAMVQPGDSDAQRLHLGSLRAGDRRENKSE